MIRSFCDVVFRYGPLFELILLGFVVMCFSSSRENWRSMNLKMS